MANKHPDRPRRRPGRLPANRPPGAASGHGPRPPGFIHSAMRPLFDAVLPRKDGERKQFYNQAASGLVIGRGPGGAMIGGSWAGVVGAVIGFGLGATAGGCFVEKGRYYRR